MQRIDILENNIHLSFLITDQNEIKLLHFSRLAFHETSIQESELSGFRLLEMQLSGVDRPEERHGIKYTVTGPGYRMKYVAHKDYRNEIGRKLEIKTIDEETKVSVVTHMQFYDGISVISCYNEVKNEGGENQTLEYISSFNLNGIEKEGLLTADEKMKVVVVHNSWVRELQVKTYTLPELGLERSHQNIAMRSSKAFGVTNKGNWSAKEYIPMGMVMNEETDTSLFWQIEHNGSWHWEISDQTNHLYVQISGPTENEAHWCKVLKPGDTFESVPVAIGCADGGMKGAIRELTKYRRVIRRKNADNEKLPVIFNDYMNCLWADPTTEKELPLIDKAAQIGSEYFCIDAGWYDAGFWWDGVGEWEECEERFPGGLKKVTSYIREKGMIPGLWLELEVMGIKCKLANQFPDECFFIRHGKRVYDRSRYQLDFRHEKVIAHVTGVVDRLVRDYGIGYIKMDYNIEPGIGTEVNADSFGEGLLGHERAYLNWIDAIFNKYPDLVIENCSSGGLRMDYAMLKRHSIQSTSDQEDYRHYATIAANSPFGLTMEQAAVWSYPKTDTGREETVFNMVNAMLLRIHQSGHMVNIPGDELALVKEGIDYYKTIRGDIKNAYAFWPLGVSKFSDDWVSLGLETDDWLYIAVWRRGGKDSVTLPLPRLKGKTATVQCAYPSYVECEYHYNEYAQTLTVKIPTFPSARLFSICLKSRN